MIKIYPLPALPVFMVALFFTALVATGQNAVGQTKSITDIPTKAHDREVDLFFNDERPKEPFYKVKIVETTAAPNTSMDAMLIQLKKTARTEGIDGIMIGDPGKQANNVVTYPNGNEFISYQKLAGIGIRYRRTIDYMDTILMEQLVSLWSNDNTEPKLFVMKYDYYGNNLSANEIKNTYYSETALPAPGR